MFFSVTNICMMKQGQEEVVKARDYACKLLSYRQRSTKELTQRLKRKGFTSKAIRETVEYLRQLDYLNDENFAKSWIHDKMRSRPAGLTLFRYELRRKGIAGEVLQRALSEYASNYNEYEVAKNVAITQRNRYKDLASLKVKKRIYGYLLRRGFAQDAILQAIE